MTKRFYFVRHGESESNITGILSGPTSPLTEHGKEQSCFLARRFESIPVDIIVASPFVRTRQTAEIFTETLKRPVLYSNLVAEWRIATIAQGYHTKGDEYKTMMEGTSAHADDADWHYGDGENLIELAVRAREALLYLVKLPHNHIVVITHGGILRMMLAAMLYGTELTSQAYTQLSPFFQTTNTGITVCEYDTEQSARNGWRLITWNDHAHLGEVM